MTTLEPGPGRVRALRERVRSTTASHYLIWALLLLIVAGPVCAVAVASVWSTPLYESDGHLTLDNYRALLTDPVWWGAVGNSLVFATMATASSIVLGVTAAVLLTRSDLPFRRSLTGVFVLPVLLPGLVLIVGWMATWAPSGYVSSWLELNTVLSFPIDLFSLTGMALVATSVAAPTVFLLCRSTVLSIDPSLEDAARSSGAGPIRALVSVTVPLLRPAIINSGLLVFAITFEVLGLPLILGFPNDITLVSTYLYDNWLNVMPADQGLVSAGAMFLLGCVSGLLVLRNRLVGDTGRYATVMGKSTSQRTVALGLWRWPLSILLGSILLVLVIVPIGGVLMSSVTSIFTPLISPWSVLTTENFQAVFNNPVWMDSVVNSVLIATVGGLLATAAIAVLSVVAHRSEFRFRRSLQQAMLWPRMMPGLVTGMAFFWAFVILDPSGAVRGSLWGLGLAFAVRSLAIGYSAFYPALAAIGRDLDLAARTSGAGWWRSMFGVSLRLCAPAMGVCFILLFVAMLNDADPAVFLVTDETPVMGLTMLQLAATSAGGAVAAFGVIQMLITVAVLGLGRIFLEYGPMPDLTLTKVAKSFGDNTVLHNLDLHVRDGELFTLLGPSGCGKSTTLWSIAGLLSPDSGRIAFGDRVVFDGGRTDEAPERRNCGVVFQSYAVWPHLRVRDNVGYPLKLRKVPRQERAARVQEILELVELGELAARYPHELSGGQQQRVALARALAHPPDLLLLDEPFSNLDAKLRERARDWFRTLQQRVGVTTVFVTHDQDEALSMSDRIVVMNHGRVRQIGTPEEVYAEPADPFVADFVGTANLLSGTAEPGPDGTSTISIDGLGQPLRADAEVAARGPVQLSVRPEQIRIGTPDAPLAAGGNVVAVKVQSAAYLGDHYRYVVEVGASTIVIQSVTSIHHASEVTIELPAHSIRLYPVTGEQS